MHQLRNAGCYTYAMDIKFAAIDVMEMIWIIGFEYYDSEAININKK